MNDLKPYYRTGREMPVVETFSSVNDFKGDSAVLARLVEEVRNNVPDGVHCFDRVHNRHNRS
jgi:hypothetical protein